MLGSVARPRGMNGASTRSESPLTTPQPTLGRAPSWSLDAHHAAAARCVPEGLSAAYMPSCAPCDPLLGLRERRAQEGTPRCARSSGSADSVDERVHADAAGRGLPAGGVPDLDDDGAIGTLHQTGEQPRLDRSGLWRRRPEVLSTAAPPLRRSLPGARGAARSLDALGTAADSAVAGAGRRSVAFTRPRAPYAAETRRPLGAPSGVYARIVLHRGTADLDAVDGRRRGS